MKEENETSLSFSVLSFSVLFLSFSVLFLSFSVLFLSFVPSNDPSWIEEVIQVESKV